MIDFILHNPLSYLILTIALYAGIGTLAKKTKYKLLLNPALWTIIICIFTLKIFSIDFNLYENGTQLISFFLGPVTVALAIPLYKQLHLIKRYLVPIGFAVLCGCFIAAGSGYALTHIFGGSEDLELAILTKSVTIPIALGIGEKIDAIGPLIVLYVYLTGIPGALIALGLFKALKIKSDEAIGLAMGVTSHGFGTAFAFEKSEKAGTFAALGMSLMGIISGILLPIIVLCFLS